MQNDFHLPIKDIQIKDRFRTEFDEEDLKKLAQDIKVNGLTNPITLDQNHRLLCGERRLRAFVLNGETDIPVRIMQVKDDTQAKVIEINENVLRNAFTWWEDCYAIRELHNLMQEEFGAAKRGSDEGWGLVETGAKVHRSKSSIHNSLNLAEYLDKCPEAITECKSAFAAVKYIKDKLGGEYAKEKATRALKKGKAKAIKINPGIKDVGQLTPIFAHADCLKWIPEHIPEPIVSLFFIDPPYGIEAHKTTTVSKTYKKHYDDSSGFDWRLRTYDILKTCYNVAIDGAHCYLFFGMVLKTMEDGEQKIESLHQQLIDLISSTGWSFDPLPLIWPKGDSGSAGRDFSRNFIPGYEPIFFLWKEPAKVFNIGHRHNLNILPTFKGVHGTMKIHPAHKPIELYTHLIDISGIPGGVMLDPCAGSGESGKAALSRSITPILIEKDEENFARMVNYVQK